MSYNFTDLMLKKSDDELITILTARREEYSEAALAAAQNEFDKRQIPKDKIEKVQKEQTLIKEKETALANEPLERDIKILAMILPLIARIIYGGKFRREGYDRKYAELYNAIFKGRLIYITAFVLLMILSNYFK